MTATNTLDPGLMTEIATGVLSAIVDFANAIAIEELRDDHGLTRSMYLQADVSKTDILLICALKKNPVCILRFHRQSFDKKVLQDPEVITNAVVMQGIIDDLDADGYRRVREI